MVSKFSSRGLSEKRILIISHISYFKESLKWKVNKETSMVFLISLKNCRPQMIKQLTLFLRKFSSKDRLELVCGGLKDRKLKKV